jgi:hypothetical protein
VSGGPEKERERERSGEERVFKGSWNTLDYFSGNESISKVLT